MKISRRNTLKSLGVGSIWVTPIIESILLPAHAQTSSTLIYSTSNNDANPRKISALIENDRIIIRMRYFFEGDCSICGSDVDYESIGNLPDGGTLNIINAGCSTAAPASLGQTKVQNYTYGDSKILISIISPVVRNETFSVPIGRDFDLGAIVCS